jgi:hypothetical protein
MLAKAGVTGGDRKRSKSTLRRKLTPGVRRVFLTDVRTCHGTVRVRVHVSEMDGWMDVQVHALSSSKARLLQQAFNCTAVN